MKNWNKSKTETNIEPKTHKKTNSTSENSKTTEHPKNVQETSEGGQLEKKRITECYNIHRRNHENYGNLRKTSEKSLRYQCDPNRNIINLTKHSFTKTEYKLLN